ncbi:MAG: hypothetical protein PHY79_06040 [Anaerolineae bacterium]|nr:hypothetical protein [Anaerolineae bacterium]MDX9829808.1 hypothetical protein [Anaerolineae bacterium]
MLADVKTLLWLQGRLVRSMFRSRRLHVWAQLGRVLLMLLLLAMTLPLFFGMGLALGWGVTRLSPDGALELLLIVNSAMLFFWLLLPASYNSEIMERFELSRLFVHPVRFPSLVTGSIVVSLLSYTGLWSLLILLGEIAGLAWHKPLALPLILVGAVPTFAILVLGGRLMDDLLDLVAGDRRLRGLLLFLTSMPLMLIIFGNYYIQVLVTNPDTLLRVLEPWVGDMPSVEGLAVSQAIDLILTHLRPSRLLLWLPPGWGTAAMAAPVTGQWATGLGFLVLSLAFSGLLLWIHAAVTRRMMQGAALRIGTERVRSRRWRRQMPGPAAFWALWSKDWYYLRRSPITPRALLSTPIIAVAFGFGLWQMSSILPPESPFRAAIPLVAGALVLVSANLGTSTLAADYLGTIDREGLASLLLTPVDRRLVLLSSTAVTLLLGMAQSLVLLVAVAIFTGSWIVLPWGLYFALCLHFGTMPLYHLSSILAPYRAPLQAWGGKGGNMGVFIAWTVGTPPIVALFVLPALLWPPAQIVTLPLAAVYAFGLYALTLKPIATLMDRRTHQILEAITEES